ncbi:MAG: 50S ribosomal protein L4 [Candidatus Omnitrophica bacterium]|nr:50S ribosomal protein L4 [Candidatus Omnitrophota bacterium]
MPELTVVDINGQKAASVTLPDGQFGVHVHNAVMHQAVVMYRANKRQGNASTKDRAAVSGGGKKPWRQKGTGRARAGSSRSPLWKKGGIIFGPQPRDFSYTVPRKIRIAALRESLNAKFLSNELVCVDKIDAASGKTKDFAHMLEALKLQGRVLAVLDGADKKALLAGRNIPRVTLTAAPNINAEDILSNKNLLVTKAALETLLKRIE